MRIRLVVTGRGYHTAEHLPDSLDMPDGAGVDDVIRAIAERLGTGADLSSSCLVVVSGRHVGTLASHEAAVLQDGDEVALIAPVAGG